MPDRLTRAALVALAVVALTTAGIGANFVLLGYADPRYDPVGKLTPRADITQPASPAAPQERDDEHSEENVEEPDD